MNPLRVLSIASEVYPLVKTGGLAHVAGALPGALERRERRDAHARSRLSPGDGRPRDERAGIRLFRAVRRAGEGAGGARQGARSLRHRCAASVRSAGQSVSRSERAGLGRQRTAFRRSGARGADIGKGSFAGFAPDVVHGHDWQGALAPAYLHYDGGARPGTVLTIHKSRSRDISPPRCSTCSDCPRTR